METTGDIDNDVPELLDCDPDFDGDDDDDEWEDEEEEMYILTEDVTCLFCDNIEHSVESLLTHCANVHNFDLVENCKRWSIDSISYIKLINYIRVMKPSRDDIMKALSSRNVPWASDDFMHAARPDDLMLQFDIEWTQSHPISDNGELEVARSLESGDKQSFEHSYSESEAIGALVDRIHRAEEQGDFYKSELDRALADIERLRICGQQLVMGVSSKEDKDLNPSQSNGLALHEEDGYFASYSHHDIHMTMLKDKVRTESYRDFMLKNPHLFEGKLVLDVGCGTGILSMFAVKAGAKHVVAVDQSNIIYQAMDIARENNLHERITFVKGRLEDATLPFEKFDVIISEWMGYFLLFEAMLNSVLWARDRYLSASGCVYPDHFSMLVVGVCDPDMRSAKLEFWNDVYGFKMSCMKSSVTDEVLVKLVNKEKVVTEPAVIKEIDVMKCQENDLDFTTVFSLKSQSDADITAIVGYFDTDFAAGCSNKISFSTGPHATPTHWEQAVMLLPSPIPVKQGANLDCKMIYRKHPNDSRGIIISLSIGKLKLKYSLS